jgi:hypothetical protein
MILGLGLDETNLALYSNTIYYFSLFPLQTYKLYIIYNFNYST